MSIGELGQRELELYSQICEFEGTIEEKVEQMNNSGITNEYKLIHLEYSRQAKSDLEALKRGLFIMWYALTEPTWLTGIGELDIDAEERIVKILNHKIANEILDYELDWMLEYYSDFGFAFERFKQYEHFCQRTSSKTGLEFPDSISKEAMATRGQMGKYFNSIELGQWNKYR